MRRIFAVVGLVASVAAVPIWASPALAVDQTAPRIKAARALDANRDDHVDGFRLTYTERVRHPLDTDGHYPFAITGYHINRVGAAAGTTTLVIKVRQHTAMDIEAHPPITYSRTTHQPVKDLAGNQAINQAFTGTKPLDLDGDGFTAVGGDCAPTNPAIGPGAPDQPDLKFNDTNCDHIDGNAAESIFVSLLGNDASPGTEAQPKLTIEAAVTAATATTPPKQVYVAAGTYSTPLGVSLATGLGIFGGYNNQTNWSRSLSNITTITGEEQAALADGDTGVVLQLLTLHASLFSFDRNVYGVRAINGSGVKLQHVTVVADPAGAGSAGAAGFNGASGHNGALGGAGSCDTNQPGGAGGSGGSGGGFPGGAGGKGGDAPGLNNGAQGQAGTGPSPGLGGTGGAAGNPGAAGTNGSNGGPGGAGANGSGGSNTLALAGSVWQGVAGTSGTGGAPGSGGGGGGGGGSQSCFVCDDGPGNGGGGGGSGGGGGGGSGGGAFGGGSFAVYLFNSHVDLLSGSQLAAGRGGTGGTGSAGGSGGAGGTQGFGATVCTLEVGAGGNGGFGGFGGDGGAGGGGAGGPSIGVFEAGPSSTESHDGTESISHGSGGAGGTSPGSAGATGQSGNILP